MKQHQMKGKREREKPAIKRREKGTRKAKESAVLKKAEGHSSTLLYPSPVSLLSHEETRVGDVASSLCTLGGWHMQYLTVGFFAAHTHMQPSFCTYCMLHLTFDLCASRNYS